jgi:hypothetical protein
VEIIKDSRSTRNTLDRTKRVETLTLHTNQNTQPGPSKVSVDEYNEINANRSDNLRKESEVELPKKRGNFNNFKGRKKFQLNNN